MIDAFESSARRFPERTCFTSVDASGRQCGYSYREARLIAASLAQCLGDRGVQRGDGVAVDLPNDPAFVFLLLAAGYGGFSLVVLNNRLNDAEKLSRRLEVERAGGEGLRLVVDEGNVDELMGQAMARLEGKPADARGRGPRRSGTQVDRTSFVARSELARAESRTDKALGRAQPGKEAARRRADMARQDALEGVIHYAEHSAHLFDRATRAVVMFTSGTTGRPKAVPLRWRNLCESAEASNAAMGRRGEGLWQAVLPLCHVGGLQVIVRSLLNRSPFVLYRSFDARQLLDDGARRGATHVSVVDKMLRDMLDAGRDDALRRYRCILLGGGPLNQATVERAQRLGLRVYASYGMTETSSQVAHELITPSFDGGMRLLPGCQARVVDPDEEGFGRLSLRAPGLFDGYLNARAARTVDGFFLTGDTAALREGRLYLRERTGDMFVSGGENVYPAEVRQRLLQVPGVADAFVLGVPDATWGRRPVAFVERAGAEADDPSSLTGRFGAGRERLALQRRVRTAADVSLSRIHRPKHVFVLDELPRAGIGKVDRARLERLYDERLEVVRVTLHRIRLPFKHPFRTAKGVLRDRELAIVELTDHVGRTGLGECVAFPTDWYLPETLDEDLAFLRDTLAPLVLAQPFLHPDQASIAFSELPGAERCPMACGAIEPALWDLYGQVVEKPLWRLLQESSSGCPAQGEGPVSVRAGAVIGVGSPAETAEAARRCAEAGYSRIKLKVAPRACAAQCVRAAQAAAPHAMITLDANQGFSLRDAAELQELDGCGAAWIEEPLSFDAPGIDRLAALAQLQQGLHTPVCVDESIARADDLFNALSRPELRCYALKVGKLGGVRPSLDFLAAARERGIQVWMGGMYDTGVSKRLHAAFQTLPGIDAPGDIGSTSRYFDVDVTCPPYEASGGSVTLNTGGHEFGLGCELDREALERVLVDRVVIEP